MIGLQSCMSSFGSRSFRIAPQKPKIFRIWRVDSKTLQIDFGGSSLELKSDAAGDAERADRFDEGRFQALRAEQDAAYRAHTFTVSPTAFNIPRSSSKSGWNIRIQALAM